MRLEPVLDGGHTREVVGRGGGVRAEGGKRLVVGAYTRRDVVRALPAAAHVGLVVDVLLVERRTHVEGVERRVVVVAHPAPCEELGADVELLPGQDVHARHRGAVVEGVPVELLAVVAHHERL